MMPRYASLTQWLLGVTVADNDDVGLLWGSRLQATKEKPTFKYLDIPDDQLDEAQLKEKRKERMFKGAYEARERARAAKLAEQKLKVSQSRRRSDADKFVLAKPNCACHIIAMSRGIAGGAGAPGPAAARNQPD